MARSPLTSVPAARSSAVSLRTRRRLLTGLVGLSVLSGFGSCTVSALTKPAPPAAVVLPDQSAVSLAQTVAGDFLSGRVSSVPAVPNVETDFSKSLSTSRGTAAPLKVDSLTFTGSAPFTLGNGKGKTLVTEQERFTASIGGVLYEVTVPMAKAGASWRLAAAPSLAPARTAATDAGAGLDYKDLYPDLGGTGTDLPPGYAEQIAKWATTFAKAGKADRDLLAITDDISAENHTYSGLGGWSVVGQPSVGSVVKVTSPYPGYIVSVGLVLSPSAANGPTLSTTYDLYLRSDRNPTQPPVVAWGPAGSYKSLQPYFNADPR